MPSRWVDCPVMNDPDARRAKVGHFRDPGTPETLRTAPETGDTDTDTFVLLRNRYRYAACISSGRPGEVNDRCLVFVRGEDFAPLDADPEIINVLEQDLTPNMLADSPTRLGWDAARIARLRQRLVDRGVDVRGLTSDRPLWEHLQRLGRRVNPSFTPRGTFVR